MKIKLLMVFILFLGVASFAYSGPISFEVVQNSYDIIYPSSFDQNNPQSQPIVFWLTITNNDTVPRGCKIAMEFSSNNFPNLLDRAAGMIEDYTALGSSEIDSLLLQPGQSIILTNRDILNSNVSITGDWSGILDNNPDFEDIILGDGFLPADTYSFTLYCINPEDEDENWDVVQAILIIRNPSSVDLIYPGDEFSNTPPEINASLPIFTWFSTATEFTFQLFEVEENQTVEDIINTIPYYEQTGVSGNILNYPESAPPLNPNCEYAWRVIAIVYTTLGEQEMESGLWNFTIQGTEPSTISIELIYPGESFSTNPPEISENFPTFTWFSTANEFTFQLFEVGENQTVEDIINDIPYYEQPEINGSILTYPESAPPLNPNCEYAWRIIAFLGEQELESDVWNFLIHGQESIWIDLVYPGEPFSTDPPEIYGGPANFTWLSAATEFTFQIFTVGENQTVEDIINDIPYYEQPEINANNLTYPESAPPLIQNTEYAWRVIAFLGEQELESELWNFFIPSPEIQIELLGPGEQFSPNPPAINTNLPIFAWFSTATEFTFQIFEVEENETVEEIINGITYHEQPGISSIYFEYPESAPPLNQNTEYAWRVIAYIGEQELESELWNLIISGTQVLDLGATQISNLIEGLAGSGYSPEGLEGFAPSGVVIINGEAVNLDELMELINGLLNGTIPIDSIFVE
ncbi:MAG: hypothetical protein U9P79_07270 [Candidatus Cloacimonadota bacterium]|nr:hypothetical protein [Candidatus Cloacimonadota bacterium]